MTDRIQAEILAVDNASPKFKNVADAAKQMDQSLEKSTSTAQQFSRAGAAVGAALGSLAGILGDAARANAEAETSQTRLMQSVENTGSLYEEYAQQLDAAGKAALQMGFDDEDAADSMSTLTQATNDTQEAINDMSLVMDIARARNIDLASATKIVVAAEQERFGALARIGIQLDDTATKEEALAALRERYSGQAAAYAQTESAEIDRLSNSYENALEAIGGYTGQAQTLLILLPGLSAGFTALSAAVGGVATKLGMTGGFAVGARGLLGLLAGPVGIAAAITGVILAAEKLKMQDPGRTVAEAYKQAAFGHEQLVAVQQQLAMTSPQEYFDTQRGEASVGVIKAMIQSANELYAANDKGADALAELHYNQTTANAAMQEYHRQLGDVYDAVDSVAEIESDIASIYANAGPGRKDAINDYRTIQDQWESGQLTAVQYGKAIDDIADSQNQYNIAALQAAEANGDSATSFGQVAIAATQTGATIESTGAAAAVVAQQIEDATARLEQQFKLTEAAYRGTTDALEAGFRTAVGNTNAIAQQSQAVADWATNLIDAQGAYSELDKLVAEGRITGESGQFEGVSQYAAAQRAYNSILEDNANIQRDILAIQAQQAPTIAAMVDAQADYIEGLRTGTAEEQMRALAYMDSATSAQALQLAQGYLQNQDVFGPMITQAAALDPYLAIILEDMGIITRGADGSITLAGVDTAQSELSVLTDAIRQLTIAQWVATFDGDPGKAELAYETVMGDAEAWDNLTSTSTIDADTAPADTAIAGVASDLNVLGATTVTPTVTLNDNASSGLQNISALLWGLQDRTVTVTTINQTLNPYNYLGGVPHYAGGGITAEMGEAGDEDLFYPNGSRGRTRGRGLYTVPKGTYVRPASSSGDGSGLTLIIEVQGNVFGIEDLTAAVAGVLAPAIIDVLDDMELTETK